MLLIISLFFHQFSVLVYATKLITSVKEMPNGFISIKISKTIIQVHGVHPMSFVVPNFAVIGFEVDNLLVNLALLTCTYM